MLFDEDRDHEYEPDPEEGLEPDVEPDPEADLPDYESELPDVPEPPEVELTETDVPPKIAFTFWYLVIVFNGALLAGGVGAMFALSGRDVQLGLRLLGIGAVLGSYGFYRYWTSPYRGGIPEEEQVTPEDDTEEADATPDQSDGNAVDGGGETDETDRSDSASA